VHIPCCSTRCDYCAFATWTDRPHLMGDYASACRTEILTAALPPATSVFFGGGTPSLLPAELLVSILEAIPLVAGAEVTVECNPDTVSLEQLLTYHRAGVNRLSFGVQSMVPQVLASLGREHDVASVRRATGWAAEAGFTHRLPRRLRDAERAENVHPIDEVPVLFRHPLKRRVAEDARVVDDDVDALPNVERVLDDLRTVLDRVVVG
jgi:hypothetical protein